MVLRVDKSIYKSQAILRNLKPVHLKNKEFVGFDIETYGKENKFYMGGVYSDKYGYIAFYDKEKMMKWFLKEARKNKTLQVVATNLLFDFAGSFLNTPYWNDFDVMIKQGKLLCASKKTKNYVLEFRDTLNYGPLSVAVMGDILNIPKLKTPKCILNDNLGFARLPKTDEEKEELEIYNKRDCEITFKFMKFLQEGFTKYGGKTKLTSASTSMDIFRRKHLKKWIFKEDLILKRDPENTIHKEIFESYYGGRTETFKRGLVKNLNVYDINSMYPHAMLNEFPHPQSVKLIKDSNTSYLEYKGVSKVDIESSDLYFPLLPFRKLNNTGHPEKLLFPKGKLKGQVYTHLELKKALELGYNITKFYYSIIYTRSIKPFESYVLELYKDKLKYTEAKSPMKHITKLLMNSLYGRFGMKKIQETLIKDIRHLTREERQELKDLDIHPSGFITSYKEKSVYKPSIVPIWVAYITAYSRVGNEEGRNGLYYYLSKYKGMYCDTDSIATKKTMPESNKLGGMKLEYNVKTAMLVKPKMYMYELNEKDEETGENKFRISLKGVPTRTQSVFNDILAGKKIYYDKFTKLKEGIKRNIPVNSVRNVFKLVDLEDTKRKWLNSFNPQELEDSEALRIN